MVPRFWFAYKPERHARCSLAKQQQTQVVGGIASLSAFKLLSEIRKVSWRLPGLRNGFG